MFIVIVLSQINFFFFFFTAQTNPIKMLRVLFLRPDRSDQSDFARSKATERLDKPDQFQPFSRNVADKETNEETKKEIARK